MAIPNASLHVAFSAGLCLLLLFGEAAAWPFGSATFSRGVRALLQAGIQEYGPPSPPSVTDQNTDAAFVSIPIDVVDEASVAAAPVYVGWPEELNMGHGCELLQKEGCAYCEVINDEPLCLACRAYFRTLENGTCVRDSAAPAPGPDASYDDYVLSPQQPEDVLEAPAPQPAI